MNVCDECLLVAYDEGIYDGEEQARVMVEMGADVQDHTCESVEEPDITCFCGCRDAYRNLTP